MKPSKIKIPKAKKAWLLLPNFRAITWRGTVYCKRQSDVEALNTNETIDSSFKSHETIHIRQAQAMNDSWIRFYLNYIFNWIKNFPLITVNIYAMYKLIPTEIEAYLHQDNWKYAENAEPVYEWKEFQKLTLKQKRKIATLYYKTYKKRVNYSSMLYNIFVAKNIYL